MLKLMYIRGIKKMEKYIKKVLISENEIIQKCKELGNKITNDYKGKDILLVGLLKGSVPFMAELSKHIKLKVKFDYIKPYPTGWPGARQGFLPLDGKTWHIILPLPWLWKKLYHNTPVFNENYFVFVDFL
jgi:hypothetical protein